MEVGLLGVDGCFDSAMCFLWVVGVKVGGFK